MEQSDSIKPSSKERKTFTRFLRDFFETEASGGIIMMSVALIAIIVANMNGFDTAYEKFIHRDVRVGLGSFILDMPLKDFVKDVLMVIFFLFVGLELKREMLQGFLSKKGQKLLPALAAAGGIICPAVIYCLINMNNPLTLNGWAIPTATDIAFAVGVLSIIGRSVPPAAKIFLLAIAIYDDIAAIIIVALFYGNGFHSEYLPIIFAVIGLLYMINSLKVAFLVPYYMLCGILAILIYKTGLHGTIAGIITAFFIPIRLNKESNQSPLGRAIHYLHPWVAYFILPLFAFVSMGITFQGFTASSFFDPLPLGITLSLFFGKQIGVFIITYLSVKFGVADKPEGTNWLQIYAVACLTGIGFTMSLFIGLLAFDNSFLQSELKIGIIIGSLLSAMFAIILIKFSQSRNTESFIK